MTTGRINQVTVLHARIKPHEAAGTRGFRPLPCARVSHRLIQVVPPERELRDPSTLSGDPSHSTASRVPSPPISHASGAFHQSSGLASTPSVKTTNERPHRSAARTRRISDLFVAD